MLENIIMLETLLRRAPYGNEDKIRGIVLSRVSQWNASKMVQNPVFWIPLVSPPFFGVPHSLVQQGPSIYPHFHKGNIIIEYESNSKLISFGQQKKPSALTLEDG